MSELIKVYGKQVSVDSLRIVRSRDITEVRVAYAEFMTGVPLDDDCLLELDEVIKDTLYEVWEEACQVPPGIGIVEL